MLAAYIPSMSRYLSGVNPHSRKFGRERFRESHSPHTSLAPDHQGYKIGILYQRGLSRARTPLERPGSCTWRSASGPRRSVRDFPEAHSPISFILFLSAIGPTTLRPRRNEQVCVLIVPSTGELTFIRDSASIQETAKRSSSIQCGS